MSGSKVVMRFTGIITLLMVVGCTSQNITIAESSPYFNAGRPHATYPQGEQVMSTIEKQIIQLEPFKDSVTMPPQFIGRPKIAQKFDNNEENDFKHPEYVGHFVPILQQSFDITPEGSYTFRYSYQFTDRTQIQESGGLRYPAVQDEPSRFGINFMFGAGSSHLVFKLIKGQINDPPKPYSLIENYSHYSQFKIKNGTLSKIK